MLVRPDHYNDYRRDPAVWVRRVRGIGLKKY
jgi:hypothetical protein